jgi:urocanate hydratase
MRRLALAALAAITSSCALLSPVDTTAALVLSEKRQVLYEQQADAYLKTIAASEAAPEVKTAFEAAIAKGLSQYREMAAGQRVWIESVGNANFQTLYETARDLLDQYRSDR